MCLGFCVNAPRVSGLVIHQGRNEPMGGTKVTLLKSSGRIYQTVTKSDGKFKFKKIRSGMYSIKISGFGIADTVFKQVSVSGDTSMNLIYSVYCRFDKSAGDKRCPICRKDDTVIPIRYGLNGVTVPKVGQQALENQNQLKDEFFPGGCLVTSCDPNWYCKRDQLEF
ncbi:MAG: carboxypeptidase regulatory-like domain-containing protein [Chitinophagaceae bacterium]